jgi:cob(I)alamin adenosyltransferase
VKLYTKTGDAGSTGLFGGGRVPKSDHRVAAYGDVDELNAAVGLVRSVEPVALAADLLAAVQRDLLAIGGQLASPEPAKVAQALAKAALGEERVSALERAIDQAEAGLEPLAGFILPGGAPKAAAFHLARTVCRRAERSVVTLAGEATVPPIILAYLNRLSDLLFVLARRANAASGVRDVTW